MAKANLGILLQDLRGKAGNAVFQKGKDGIVVRARVQGTNPQTGPQMAVRAALTKASQQFETFSTTQFAAWQNYSENVTHHNRVTGKPYHPTAFNAFTELAAKYYQVTPAGTAPTTPPTTQFTGDPITITATADTGKVTFTASAANSADVVTEFLLQPLKTVNRKAYPKNYRSKGFFQFVSGTLTHDITVPAGHYAAAYRFVNKNTGQATEPVYLTIQTVTLSLSKNDSGTQRSTTKKAA